MTSQLSNSCTTTAYASMDGHSMLADDERERMLHLASQPPDDIPLYRLDSRRGQTPVTAVALVPVVVPLVSAAAVVGLQLDPAAAAHQRPSHRRSLRRHSSNVSGGTREVKFDETVLWTVDCGDRVVLSLSCAQLEGLAGDESFVTYSGFIANAQYKTNNYTTVHVSEKYLIEKSVIFKKKLQSIKMQRTILIGSILSLLLFYYYCYKLSFVIIELHRVMFVY